MNTALSLGCDRKIAEAARPAAGAAAGAEYPQFILVTTILASSLAFIDGSVVNVGLPAIGASLEADGSSLSWVVNLYLLPLSALLLIGGAAGDLYGRRRLLLLGVGFFAAASLFCAVAPGLSLLLAGRLAQGVGAAMLLPNSLAILGASFTGEARGRAIGIWAAVGAAAGAIGPLIGGWLIDIVGWRAVFLVNLPIAAAALYFAARYLRDERTDTRVPLDWTGAVLATGGLAALTWALTIASSAKPMEGQVFVLLAAGVVFLVLFVIAESRRGPQAMLPLVLFGSPSFIGLTLLTLLLYGALGGLLVLVPYVLIQAHHYSATGAGAALLPLPLMIALTSSTMGRIAGRIGSRLPLTIGPMIVAGGCLLAVRIAPSGDYWTATLPAMLVIAVGMSCAVAPLTTAVLGSVDQQHSGVASGFNSAIARTGGLVATALLSAILASHGEVLVESYETAAMIGALVALAAGASAFVLVRPS
jgi:EmrB/QacA subfamily drug resistance transporter